MADKKITQLTNITGANLAEADEFVVVDITADETKAITFSELKTAFDTSTGFVRITGDTMTGNLSFGDNDKAIFGADSDLQIYNDGTDSYITDTTGGNFFINDDGAGYLMMKGSDLYFRNPSNADMIHAQSGGFVKLYHNNAPKLATTSTGINVTGTVSATDVSMPDDGILSLGTSDELTLKHHNSGYSHLTNTTGTLFIDSDSVTFRDDDGSPTNVLINQSGIDVTGTVTADGLSVGHNTSLYTSDASLSNYSASNGVYLNGNAGGWLGLSADGTRYTNWTLFGGTTGSANLKTANKNRINVDGATGDISFYEDTGTTPKLFWDASAEELQLGGNYLALTPVTSGTTGARISANANGMLRLASGGSDKVYILDSGKVGIGTSSPSTTLHLSGLTGSPPKLTLEEGGAESRIYATKNSPTNSDLRFQTEVSGTIADRMIIDYSGNLLKRNNGNIEVGGYGNGTDYGVILTPADGGGYYHMYNDAGGHLAFGRGNTLGSSESMRIDASGNLLVSATTTSGFQSSSSVSGTIAYAAGGIASNSPSNDVAGVFNRLGTDGIIVQLKKDGSTIGSIGVASEYLYIHGTRSTDAGLMLGSQVIAPASSTGANRNNAIDLGFSGNSFKDLYLSGGVDFGGAVNSGGVTSSSNKLDDYEEGTFTPSISGLSFTTVVGTYVKVGKMCLIGIELTGSNNSLTGDIYINGLPFTSTTAGYGANSVPLMEVSAVSLANGYTNMYGRVSASDSRLQILQSAGNAHTGMYSGGGLSSGAILRTSFTYRTQ